MGINPKYIKKQELNGRFAGRIGQDVIDVLKAHNVNISKVCQDALMDVYRELLSQTSNDTTKRSKAQRR